MADCYCDEFKITREMAWTDIQDIISSIYHSEGWTPQYKKELVLCAIYCWEREINDDQASLDRRASERTAEYLRSTGFPTFEDLFDPYRTKPIEETPE